ncbi:hypothetical protein Hanom_Chr15g01409921 [Helianthus anomalus]
MKQIENNSEKEKSRACVVIQDDEGFNWSEFLPEEEQYDEGFIWDEFLPEEEYGFNTALVAEVKECAFRRHTEIDVLLYRIEEMEKESEEAKNYGRYDKKRECYVNSKGEPVVHQKEVVFNDVLAVIPLSDEYYSNVEKDKDYVKKLDKINRDVMKSSLKQRDEERMKKNVESLVDELKKVANEKKVEGEKEEEAVGEDAVTEEQQNEDDLKKKEEADEKLERSVEVDDGASVSVGEKQQKKEADQN